MAANFRSLPGAWVVAGLMGTPLWLWCRRQVVWHLKQAVISVAADVAVAHAEIWGAPYEVVQIVLQVSSWVLAGIPSGRSTGGQRTAGSSSSGSVGAVAVPSQYAACRC
jgi:hypothetical protein